MKKLVVPAIIALLSSVIAYRVLTSWLGHRPLVAGLAILGGIAAFWVASSLESSMPNDVVLPPDSKRLPARALRTALMLSLGAALIAWSSSGFARNAVPLAGVIGIGAFFTVFGFGSVYLAARSRKRRIAEAFEALRKAEEIRRRANRDDERGAIVEALAGYQETLAVLRHFRPMAHISVVQALSDVSRAHLRLKHFREAVAYAKELQPLLANRSGQSPDLVQMAYASNERRLGVSYIELKDHAAAKKHLAVAVEIWNGLMLRAADDKRLSELIEAVLGDNDFPIFEDLSRYALACALGGDDAEAIRQDEWLVALETGWIASRGLDKKQLLAMADDARLESAAHSFWHPARSIRRAQQALALESAANGAVSAFAHNALGLAWEEFDAFPVARRHYELALELARVQGEGGDHLFALRGLGRVTFAQEDYSSSARFYEEALAYPRSGASERSGHDCSCLAKALLELGDLSRARSLAREAMRLDADNAVRADAYSTLSEVLAREGSSDAAIVLGKRAANIVQSRLDESHGSVLNISHRKDAAPIVRRLADHLVDAGRLPEAQQVLDLLKEVEYEEFVTRGGDRRPARETLTPRPLEGISAEAAWLRRGNELETAISLFLSEQKKLLKMSTRDAAENVRLEVLHDLLHEARQDLDEWLDQLVDTVRQERQVVEEQARNVNLTLLETLRADLAQLGPGVALAHFILGTRRLAVILTKPDLQVSRELSVDRAEIHGLLHDFRREIRLYRGDHINLRGLARKLHQYLIAPISEQLEGVETLMVVLDGALRYLPLAALHDGSKYLIERCAVTILTPASYERLKDRPIDWASGGGVGGLGVGRGTSNAKLLGAVGGELRAIIREGQETEGVYPGKRYLDERFTSVAFAAALRAHNAIHIASHFAFSSTSESASALLLGDGSELSLQQLQADDFVFGGVELVTLSACETALGTEPSQIMARQGLRHMNGVEFESLGTTIQKRGAKSVIATLWAVEDDSTAIIMKRFYQERRDGHTKAAALRRAQLALLRGEGTDKFTHPYFWAPFVLMGNWQ